MTEREATKNLKAIDKAIKGAVGSLNCAAVKRSLTPCVLILAAIDPSRQGTVDDLAIVGAVLARVISDLVQAISGIVDELKFLPLIVSECLTATDNRVH